MRERSTRLRSPISPRIPSYCIPLICRGWALSTRALGASLQTTTRSSCRRSYRNAIQKYKDNNNWLSHFLEDCCEVDPSYEAKSRKVYNAYRSYCNQMGEYIRSTTNFYIAIEAADFTRHKTKTGMMIWGFRLKSEFLD